MLKSPCAALVAAAFSLSAGAASAATCNIVGTFTDSLGSSGQFTSQTKGTVSNPSICSGVTFNLNATVFGRKSVVVHGKPAKPGSGCTSLSGKFLFQNGGCTTAKGNVTINPLGTFPDTITRTGAALRYRPSNTSALTSGLN